MHPEHPGPFLLVLWWQYLDKSGCGIIGVYQDEHKANEHKRLLEEHGSGKEFKFWQAPFYKLDAPHA